MVAEIDRIYADTPARIIDFLSMAKGASYECDQSIDLLTSLIHIDDVKATILAKKIEGIQSADQAFRLRRFVDDARACGGPDWRFTDTEAAASSAGCTGCQGSRRCRVCESRWFGAPEG